MTTIPRQSSRPVQIRSRRVVIAAAAVALFLAAVELLPSAYAEGPIGKEQESAARTSLVGSWTASVGKTKVQLEFRENGEYVLDLNEGAYSVSGNVLSLSGEVAPATYTFQFPSADQLTLSGSDLPAALQFERQPQVGNYVNWLFGLSLKTAERKFFRILIMVGLVVLSRFLISLLRRLMHAIIYTEKGPLKFLYRYNKNRAMTLNSLALNLLKYVVYFSVLGFILTEVGVNYTAYLASLSVIGLAIGFGAQGLVQDMVTGFFIILERQFDVGDMVDISSYTGVVTELGLRMTKLRNYLGQIVVIPNRNIAVVGNYLKGSQRAIIDVAVPDDTAAKEAGRKVLELAEEIARQFYGVITSPPNLADPLCLASGEVFLRLQVSIWPQQQWVIDQQIVPRIRELLKRSGIEIPGDRIAVFYHHREKKNISAWGR